MLASGGKNNVDRGSVTLDFVSTVFVRGSYDFQNYEELFAPAAFMT
jgi:hypothetical protein